jgi:hypothetical protein
LPAFIRAQVADGTLAVVGTSLFETAGEATSDIALIEGDWIECEILQQGRPLQAGAAPVSTAPRRCQAAPGMRGRSPLSLRQVMLPGDES